MSRRRDLLIGGACVAAGAAAYGLTPRRRVSLLGDDKLDAIVPRAFGDWNSVDMNDEVAPKEAGSLASRLYAQTVGRMYTNARTGAEVMLLMAHGDTQSNDLQLHRPEVCYTAFGYNILVSQPRPLRLGPSATLPLRQLTVSQKDRVQQIVYWTRIGEHLPQSLAEQRVDRMRNALDGVISDGMLVRLSRSVTSVSAPVSEFQVFIPELIQAIPPAKRKALIGSRLAQHVA